MSDFKQVFADEIRRLARKEIKAAMEPVQKMLANQRQQIAELRRQLRDLEQCKAAAAPAAKVKTDEVEDKKISRRITGRRIMAMRNKMGLSQAQFAELLGASLSSIVNWEKDKRTPRASQKEQIAGLRLLGKREIAKRLEAAGMPVKAVARKRKVAAAKEVEAVPADNQ